VSSEFARVVFGMLLLACIQAPFAQVEPPPVAGTGNASGQATKTAVPLPQVTIEAPPLPDPKDLAGPAIPDFINSHGQQAVLTKGLAHWNVGVCPYTQGLDPELNDYVSQRVRAIASYVGVLHQDRADCGGHRLRGEFELDPNVLVVFSREPQKLMDDIASHHYVLLGFHYPNQTRKLKTVNRPIQAWYVTATQSSGAAPGSGGQQEWVDDIFGTVPPGIPAGRLARGTESLFVFALIVVDVNKIEGQTVGTLADYIAVLALSQVRNLGTCNPLPSILDLLSPGCGDRPRPKSITATDLAYLRSLATVSGGLVTSLQKSEMEIRMRHQLTAQ
jgi:hypothetical protein